MVFVNYCYICHADCFPHPILTALSACSVLWYVSPTTGLGKLEAWAGSGGGFAQIGCWYDSSQWRTWRLQSIKWKRNIWVLHERRLQSKKQDKLSPWGQGSEWKPDKIKKTKPMKGSFKHGIPIGGIYYQAGRKGDMSSPIHTVSLQQRTQVSYGRTFSEYLLCTRLGPRTGEGKKEAGRMWIPTWQLEYHAHFSSMLCFCVSVSTLAPGTQSGVKDGVPARDSWRREQSSSPGSLPRSPPR